MIRFSQSDCTALSLNSLQSFSESSHFADCFISRTTDSVFFLHVSLRVGSVIFSQIWVSSSLLPDRDTWLMADEKYTVSLHLSELDPLRALQIRGSFFAEARAPVTWFLQFWLISSISIFSHICMSWVLIASLNNHIPTIVASFFFSVSSSLFFIASINFWSSGLIVGVLISVIFGAGGSGCLIVSSERESTNQIIPTIPIVAQSNPIQVDLFIKIICETRNNLSIFCRRSIYTCLGSVNIKLSIKVLSFRRGQKIKTSHPAYRISWQPF